MAYVVVVSAMINVLALGAVGYILWRLRWDLTQTLEESVRREVTRLEDRVEKRLERRERLPTDKDGTVLDEAVAAGAAMIPGRPYKR